MESSKIAFWTAVAAIVIAVGSHFLPVSVEATTGGVGTRFPNGVSANNTSPVAGQLLGTTLTVTGAATLQGLLSTSAGIQGASVNSTTTTATSQTLKVSDVQAYDTVILTPTVGSDTVTFFASSTASSWLATAGYAQRTCLMNGTTTTGINLTVAGGTGVNVQVASSTATAVGSLVIGPQKVGCFVFTRGNATATTFDIEAAFVSYL